MACFFHWCLSTSKNSKSNTNIFKRYDNYRILKSKSVFRNVQSYLLKGNTVFVSFLDIYLHPKKQCQMGILSRDFVDYKIVVYSWHCAWLQLWLIEYSWKFYGNIYYQNILTVSQETYSNTKRTLKYMRMTGSREGD